MSRSAAPSKLSVAAAATAGAHHEKLDGSGYWRGLSGHAISRPARILAVADIYEALTAGRPYRAALTIGEARRQIVEGSGTQFCPRAAGALLATLAAREEDYEAAA